MFSTRNRPLRFSKPYALSPRAIQMIRLLSLSRLSMPLCSTPGSFSCSTMALALPRVFSPTSRLSDPSSTLRRHGIPTMTWPVIPLYLNE